MLRKGIIEGMLTDSKREKWIVDSTIKAVWNPIKELFYLIVGFRPKEKPSLGQNFYNHPIIKNYGSNDRFTLPSYIPKENFSTILIEVLKSYYEEYESEIEVYVANDLKDKVDLTTATSFSFPMTYATPPAAAVYSSASPGAPCETSEPIAIPNSLS